MPGFTVLMGSAVTPEEDCLMGRNSQLLAGAGLLLGAAFALAAPLPRNKKELTFLDLQPKANAKLKEVLSSNKGPMPGNDLTALPQGEQKLGGVKFLIGKKMILLDGAQTANNPAKVEGIEVGRAFATLHILHAANTANLTPAGTVIGKYVVHYHDKTKASIDIVLGKDVLGWWYFPNSPTVTRGRVAWQGDNAAAKKNNAKVRLYLTTWKNPKPRKKVVAIDYVSSKTTAAAPFCVAMTVEGPK
jgi:hypothetical protein